MLLVPVLLFTLCLRLAQLLISLIGYICLSNEWDVLDISLLWVILSVARGQELVASVMEAVPQTASQLCHRTFGLPLMFGR